MRSCSWLMLILLLSGCPSEKHEGAPRVGLRRLGGSTFELTPTDGQHPHCLIFTVSSTGVIRQLTMSAENTAWNCPAGKRIGGHSFRVPIDEGAVKVHVLFSTQKINAASVAQQLLELKNHEQLSAMDLRLPGAVTIETLSFAPETDAAPTVGGVVGTTDAGGP